MMVFKQWEKIWALIMTGMEGVALGIFILGGVLSIIMSLVLFWTQNIWILGILGTLSAYGFIIFISLIYNLMKINIKGGAE